jgi:hypothetical protein
MELSCTDGAPSELADLVLEASGKRVTHLVVEPKHQGAARLVPLELVAEDAEGISLRCTAEALDRLEPVREFAYLTPGAQLQQGDKWDVGIEDVLVAPSVEPMGGVEPEVDQNVSVVYDRIPKGEVELRLTSSVYSADEHRVGSVLGVVVGEGGKISELRLRRGHLWWKREVGLPADTIASLENDAVTLAVTKRELKQVSSS